MKPVAASPVLHHARALGRAFLGAGRALRRGLTWFLLLAFGVWLPWQAMLLREAFEFAGPPDPLEALTSVSGVTLQTALHAAARVLSLALFVPLLEGQRRIDLRRVRSAASGLAVAAAALAGADLAMLLLWHSGWIHGLWWAVWGVELTTRFALFLVLAWVGARVLSALRGGGAWPWSGTHLLVAGALLLAWSTATWTAVEPLSEAPDFFWRLFGRDRGQLPPSWWVLWQLGESFAGLVALEYLRIEPPHAPAEADPRPDGSAG